MSFADTALSKVRRLNGSLSWAALYLVSGLLAAHVQGGGDPYLWYPPFAIGIAFLYRAGLRYWPVLFLAEFLVSLYQYQGHGAAALIASACTAIAIVGAAFALRAIKHGFSVADYRDFTWLAAICIGASLAGASLGSILLHALNGSEASAWAGWLAWWFGGAASSISLLPLILILSENEAEHRPAPSPAKPNWEQAAMLAAALAASYATFGPLPLVSESIQEALEALIFGPVIWAALRLGRRATCIAILATAVSVVLFQWQAGFADEGAPGLAHRDVLEIQLFLVALSVSGLSLSITLGRERRARIDAESREAELRKATGDLRTALTRLSMAAEAAHIGVWDWNLDDNSLLWDDQVYAMYQIDRNTPDKYQAWIERLHPDDAARLQAEIAESIRRGEEVRSNFRVLLPNGDVRYFNTHGIVQARMGGRATHIIGIDYDVTELVQQRLNAEESELKAATANRAKSEFLTIMSHELRTPLNAIIGFSDLMAREAFGPLQNPRYASYVTDIRNSGHLLLSLINDILDLTRIEAGKMQISLEPIDPNQILRDVARSLAPLASAKNQQVAVNEAPDCKPVLADPRALRQLLNNLVANGIKFTDNGGAITLAANAADADRVVLTISDNGRGIPRERIPDLGKPFVQIADPLRRDVGGIGLGLAISRSLAQAMGGTLEIDSELGKGTIVRVVLPAAPAA